MSTDCPFFALSQFAQLERCKSEKDVQQQFTPLLGRLHEYLNGLPCFRDLQQIRKQWKPNVSENRPAFSKETLPVGRNPLHWYTYHLGGRSEAQFNLGMYPTHLRIGIGFNFTGAGYGDRELISATYAAFSNVIAKPEAAFRHLVNANGFEIERYNSLQRDLQFEPTEKVVDWLLAPHQADDWWVCVGRLLWTEKQSDRACLESSSDLARTIETVFTGLKPIWVQTQMAVKSNRH